MDFITVFLQMFVGMFAPLAIVLVMAIFVGLTIVIFEMINQIGRGISWLLGNK